MEPINHHVTGAIGIVFLLLIALCIGVLLALIL